MAKKDDYPPRNKKYPWEKWLDGTWHELVSGKDFSVPVENMRSQVLLYARKHQLTVTTRTLACGNRLAIKNFSKVTKPKQKLAVKPQVSDATGGVQQAAK